MKPCVCRSPIFCGSEWHSKAPKGLTRGCQTGAIFCLSCGSAGPATGAIFGRRATDPVPTRRRYLLARSEGQIKEARTNKLLDNAFMAVMTGPRQQGERLIAVWNTVDAGWPTHLMTNREHLTWRATKATNMNVLYNGATQCLVVHARRAS